MRRRAAALGIGTAAGLSLLPGTVVAQDFPTRAISIVVPFGPGTGNDIIARQWASI
jgi:tripartite-type tricarboxylate transporter receptor subunit TctC